MLILSNKISEIRNFHNFSLTITISYICCTGMCTGHLCTKKEIVPANVTDWYIKEKANLGAAAIKLYTIQILP